MSVVGRDSNVDELEVGVAVAEGDGGDVLERRLDDGLTIVLGVADDQETGLIEVLLDLVREGTRGEATSNGAGTGVVGELEDGALAVVTGSKDADVGGVLDSGDGAGSEDDLLPGLVEVEDVSS